MREKIVTEALSWVDTPYHYHARIKGVGVDCAQLLIGVYAAVGLAPEIDPGHYPQEWHLHHSEELFQHWLSEAGARRVDVPQVGDIGLWRYGRTFSHGSIFVASDEVVHSYINLGVIRTRLDEEPIVGRLVQYWSVQ